VRWLYRIVFFLFVALSGWLGYAGWKGAKLVETILTVGSPIAQGADAKSPTAPAEIGYIGDPRMAFGYAFEEVQVNSELGRNPAWLVAAATPSGRHAIFVHGIGGRRENGYRFLPVLREAGFDTLMIAYRNDEGAPPSPDRKYSLGLNEWRDLKAAVETLQARGANTIVIVAESMGGAITGQYLANGAPPAAVNAKGPLTGAPHCSPPHPAGLSGGTCRGAVRSVPPPQGLPRQALASGSRLVPRPLPAPPRRHPPPARSRWLRRFLRPQPVRPQPQALRP